MEKISDSIKEFIEKNEFLTFLMNIVEYLIYTFSLIIIFMPFIELSDFITCVIKYSLILIFILAFAAKKYISLSILFASKMFSYIVFFIQNLVQSDDIVFSWSDFIGAIVCFMVVWLLSQEFDKVSINEKSFLDTTQIKNDIHNCISSKIEKYNKNNNPEKDD